MNHLRHLALSLLACSGLLACASTDQGAQTGSTIKRAADEIDVALKDLGATMTSLEALMLKPAQDLEPQYDAYTSALEDFEDSTQDVSDTAHKMKEQGQAYFADWEAKLAAIQNEDIRESAADRKKTVEAGFSKLQDRYGEVKANLDPLLANLRDIRTALAADLTMSGLEGLKSTAKSASKNAEDLTEDLTDLSKDFRDLSDNLARSGPPAAAPEK